MIKKDEMLENNIAMENSRVKKSLTETNFTVLSIEPYGDAKKTFNTRAVVEVDLQPELGLVGKKDKDRYLTKIVRFNRLDIAEAVRQSGVSTSIRDHFLVHDVSSTESIVNDIRSKIHIDPDEVEFYRTDVNRAALVAKPDSLGYTGHVLFDKILEIPEGDLWVDETVSFTKSYVCSNNVGDVPLNWLIPNATNYWVFVPEGLTKPMWGYIWLEKEGGRIAAPEQGLHKFHPGEVLRISFPVGNRREHEVMFKMTIANQDDTVTLPAGKIPLPAMDVVSNLIIEGPTEISEYEAAYTYRVKAYNNDGKLIPTPPGVIVNSDMPFYIDTLTKPISALGDTDIVFIPSAEKDSERLGNLYAEYRGVTAKLGITLHPDVTIPWITAEDKFEFVKYGADPDFSFPIKHFNESASAYIQLKHPKGKNTIRAKLYYRKDGKTGPSGADIYLRSDEMSELSTIAGYISWSSEPLLESTKHEFIITNENGEIILTTPEFTLFTKLPNGVGVRMIPSPVVTYIREYGLYTFRNGLQYMDEVGVSHEVNEEFKAFASSGTLGSDEVTYVEWNDLGKYNVFQMDYWPSPLTRSTTLYTYNEDRWFSSVVMSNSPKNITAELKPEWVKAGWGDVNNPITEFAIGGSFPVFRVEHVIPEERYNCPVFIDIIVKNDPSRRPFNTRDSYSGWRRRGYPYYFIDQPGDILVARLSTNPPPYYKPVLLYEAELKIIARPEQDV